MSTENVDMPIFTGETLDVRSRACVRRMIDKKMRTDWANWWIGISNINRSFLVKCALSSLDKYWHFKKDAETLACYSAEAVAEEIDFYLPKSFWKHKRKKKYSSAKTFVDPEWETFKNWTFVYPETIQRLSSEKDSILKRIEENRKRCDDPLFGKDNNKTKAGKDKS